MFKVTIETADEIHNYRKKFETKESAKEYALKMSKKFLDDGESVAILINEGN